MTAPPGLRERKNARTREAIERAAYELTLEQGYERTTVAEIAERADVAPRTVFTRYPTKDAIIFGRSDAVTGRLTEAIAAADGTLVDRLAAFIRASADAHQSAAELEKLRVRAVLSDPFLRRILRGQLDAVEEIIAQQLSAELGVPPTSAGVRIFAAGVTGLFMAMLDSSTRDPENHDALAITEAGLPVLRAALDALTAEA